METLDVDVPKDWPEEIWSSVAEVANENPEYMYLDRSEKYLISSDARTRIIDAVGDTPIVVYHATKLLEHEIESVKALGLVAVSKEMLTRRVQSAFENGYFSEEIATFLIQSGLSSANDDNRKGMIWVFTSRLALRRRHGLDRQFNLWGGEALRDNFEDGHWIFETLRALGEPTIIRGFVHSELQSDLAESFFDLPFNLLKMWGGD